MHRSLARNTIQSSPFIDLREPTSPVRIWATLAIPWSSECLQQAGELQRLQAEARGIYDRENRYV